MPSALLSLEEARVWLGLAEGEPDPQLQATIDAVHLHLEELTNRRYANSTTAIADEPYNGTGRTWLYLVNPASAVSTVKIGRKVSSPDQTLDGTDAAVLVIDPRIPRKLLRVDGSPFPQGLRNVFVSYTPKANLPGGAILALQGAVAFLWRRRGSEDALSESMGPVTHQLAHDLMEHVPEWRSWVQATSPGVG